MYTYCYQSRLGSFCVSATEEQVVGLHFVRPEDNIPVQKLKASQLTNLCATQVLQFLSGKRRVFDVPFTLQGTTFQQGIWRACMLIPYGETRSYHQVAQLAGYENSFRAAGTALKANPLQLIIPCHRVIKTNLELGEYAGGATLKKSLLELEKSQSLSGGVKHVRNL